MAGGKGNEPSKKTIEKQKQKVVEDLTFGLKNKNKSKVVQNYIKGVQQRVAGNQKKSAKDKELELKKQEKLMQKEQEKMLRELFKPVEDKKAQIMEEDEEEKTEEQILDERTRLANTQIDTKTMSLEQIIEIQRARLSGGTPVTLESFTEWKERKRQKLEDELRKKQKEAIAAFKKSGNGISGKDLFAYDATLFVDDTEAVEGSELVVDENIDIDEDLFAEDLTEPSTSGEAAQTSATGLPSAYEPDTWKFKKAPKEYLNDAIASLTVLDQPKYETIPSTQTNEFRVKCSLPPAIMNHITDKSIKDQLKKDGKKLPEFEPVFGFANKKAAEQNAALVALDWILFATKAKVNLQTK